MGDPCRPLIVKVEDCNPLMIGGDTIEVRLAEAAAAAAVAVAVPECMTTRHASHLSRVSTHAHKINQIFGVPMTTTYLLTNIGRRYRTSLQNSEVQAENNDSHLVLIYCWGGANLVHSHLNIGASLSQKKANLYEHRAIWCLVSSPGGGASRVKLTSRGRIWIHVGESERARGCGLWVDYWRKIRTNKELKVFGISHPRADGMNMNQGHRLGAILSVILIVYIPETFLN